jgi:hypothetical protein
MLMTSADLAVLTAISTAVAALFTIVYTIGTFLLWSANKKTIALLAAQMQSAAHHAVLDSHRELFFEILRNPQLCRVFAADLGLSEEIAREKYLATLLINHARRLYMDHRFNVASEDLLESFARDARELFSMPFVRQRWKEVREYHPQEFVAFVEHRISSPDCNTGPINPVRGPSIVDRRAVSTASSASITIGLVCVLAALTYAITRPKFCKTSPR